MKAISASELELPGFFEVEPVLADGDAPWPYNDFSYEVEIGPYKVLFRIAPSYLDLSLAISHAGQDIYHFSALSVDDVRYHRDTDRETLEIVVSGRDSLWFRLRPSPEVTQRVSEA